MNDIINHRKHIDKIDSRIISLLGERMMHVRAIGEIKNKLNTQVTDSKRWESLIKDRISKGIQNNLSPKLITDLWDSIHRFSQTIEKKV